MYDVSNKLLCDVNPNEFLYDVNSDKFLCDDFLRDVIPDQSFV